mgnify:FL=1
MASGGGDTAAPTVTSVMANDLLISDSDAVADTFSIAVTFSQAMKTSATPILTYGTNVASTLTLTGGAWSAGNTVYTATYNVADGNVNLTNVTVDVTGAQDVSGNAQLNYTALPEFSIDTVNPSFTSGTTATAIDENSGAGQVVYTAAATDPATDGGPSTPVTYALGGGIDDGAFTIDSDTGAVTLVADPNFETKPSYSFAVTATDAAGNDTAQTVTLDITNLDEVNPSFASGTTATAIDENSGAGHVVYTAAATDPADIRSEERRVGKECQPRCRARWSPYH